MPKFSVTNPEYELLVPAFRLLFGVYNDYLLSCILPNSSQITILDCGSGSGNMTINLSKYWTEKLLIIGIDIDPEVLSQFSANVASPLAKCITLTGDLRDEKTWGELDECLDGTPLDVVLNGFTFHHFNQNDKQKLYNNCAQRLIEGGRFVNFDIYAHESEIVSGWTLHRDLEWISGQHTNPGYFLPWDYFWETASRAQLSLQSELWVEHYLKENQPLPLSTEKCLMELAGLNEFEIVARVSQVAIVSSAKVPSSQSSYS
ncbi:MAG: class I SAM-dependent methyltransferase [Pseudomonadota bacterium]